MRRTAGARGWRQRRVTGKGAAACLALAAAVAAASGCSSSNGTAGGLPDQSSSSLQTTPLAATSSQATASPPGKAASPSEAALSQYRAFWRTLTPASSAPAGQRRAMLTPYSAEPELSSLLDGISRERAAGRVYYGTPKLHPKVTALSVPRRVAVIRDCQDATRTGDKDTATGRLLTRGAQRTLVVSTLHLLPDGKWRVAFVTFPKQRC